MSDLAQDPIKSLIEDSTHAYNLYIQSGHMNTDYADFASLMLGDFRSLLQRPEMTQRQLRRMMRRGWQTHRKSAPESCWPTFMAHYLNSEPSNMNDV